MTLAHIVLRVREPGLARPYRTPGGTVTTGIALVLAVIAVVATFFVDKLAAGITAALFVVALAYFWFYSRHHLVASAPEEEFAAIQQAESEPVRGGKISHLVAALRRTRRSRGRSTARGGSGGGRLGRVLRLGSHELA